MLCKIFPMFVQIEFVLNVGWLNTDYVDIVLRIWRSFNIIFTFNIRGESPKVKTPRRCRRGETVSVTVEYSVLWWWFPHSCPSMRAPTRDPQCGLGCHWEWKYFRTLSAKSSVWMRNALHLAIAIAKWLKCIIYDYIYCIYSCYEKVKRKTW